MDGPRSSPGAFRNGLIHCGVTIVTHEKCAAIGVEYGAIRAKDLLVDAEDRENYAIACLSARFKRLIS